jgi:hypothetical protein
VDAVGPQRLHLGLRIRGDDLTMSAPQMLRQNLRSGRATVWGGMAAIVALGWLYMVHMNAGMSAMDGMAPPAATGLGALVATFLMWTVMMVAMMLPSTIPAVSVFMMLSWHVTSSGAGAIDLSGLAVVMAGFYDDDEKGSPWRVISPTHLKSLMECTQIVPAVNQIELHPSFIQQPLRETHERLDIITQAWSPLGNSVRRLGDPSRVTDPLRHPVVVSLSESLGKTPAQVVLRWHIQHGLSAIPKSFNPAHIAENFDIFDFALSREYMRAIDAIDTGVRSGPDPEVVNANTFPIRIEDQEAS